MPLCGKDLDNIAAPRYIRGVECRKAAKDPNRRARAAETDMEDLTMAKKKSKEVQNDIMESAHKVWLAGLGAVAIAEQQGGKFFANLVDEGQKLEKKSKAKVEKAALDLSYTKVTAPITGRVSRNLVDLGNLVGESEPTLLTTVTRYDPMYAYFNLNERDLLKAMAERGGNRVAPLVLIALTRSSGPGGPPT